MNKHPPGQGEGHQQKGTESGPVINARQWTPIKKPRKLIDSNTRLETSINTKIAAMGKHTENNTPPLPPPTPEAKPTIKDQPHAPRPQRINIYNFTYKQH